ncbi:MAG: adenylosuccinate synthase [Armatimonadetes bacterium]|nr:adenylosuccinate synthase [Armatimonadota bacterium]
MPTTVVVGLQWGDEAKGKIVDYLAEHASMVVRYNGGNNAGHTVVVGDQTYKFHTMPAGILHPNVTAVIADGVVIDPAVLCGELSSLSARGIDTGKLKISSTAHVIMPWHKLLDSLEERHRGSQKIGTTGRGIGPCYQDKYGRWGLRICDLIDPERCALRTREILEYKNSLIKSVFGGEPLDASEICDEYGTYAEAIAPHVADTSHLVSKAQGAGESIVFEGAHGSLLDIDHGTYPYVTSSHPISGGATVGTGIGPRCIDEVVGVAKVYTTRVGEGVFMTELHGEQGEAIRQKGAEFGTTTGRPRRCGWFDAVAVNFTSRINSCSRLALIKLDVLTGQKSLKIATAYEIDGKITRQFPQDTTVLNRATPVYEEMPGWSESVVEARQLEHLPANARAYIDRISELVEVPVWAVSVGERRDQTILMD